MTVEDRLLQVLVNPPNLDILNGLADSALGSFAGIEKCKTQQLSDHPLVMTMVGKIVGQVDEYIRAINMSLETAQRGCEFADDAIELYYFVAKGDARIEHLKRFLSDMLDKANLAHAQALAMNQQVARVRSSLFQIAKSIPHDMKKIEQSKQGSHEFVHETVTKSFDDIIACLEHASHDLADLTRHVGDLVDWWSDMKIGLRSLQPSISVANLDGSNPLRQKVVLDLWKRLRGQYVQYHNRISVITDFYPKPLTAVDHISGIEGRTGRQATKPQEYGRQENGQQEGKRQQERRQPGVKMAEARTDWIDQGADGSYSVQHVTPAVNKAHG